MKNIKLNPMSTVSEVAEYLRAYAEGAVSVHKGKKTIAVFTYKCGAETFVKAISGDFAEFFTVDTCSIDEKSNSSRHVAETVEKSYKLRFSNIKNKGVNGRSFLQNYGIPRAAIFEMSIDDFMNGYFEFIDEYGDGATNEIAKQRYAQRKSKKLENTQLTLTVGHYIEYLLCEQFGQSYSINVSNYKNGYDVKDSNGQKYEVKSCLGKIKFDGETYSFGGSSIELSKDR